MFDVLIHDGNVIDGTGNLWFRGAIGIEGNTIRILRGDVSSVDADRKIDATGMVVCPGFIDMHTHSGLMVLQDPRHEPKVRQGITTEVIGVDGNSYAPFGSTEDFDKFLLLNAGIDGKPALPKRWLSVSDYLSLFDGSVSCNFAYFIGNAPLRIGAMGWGPGKASLEEIEAQTVLIRDGMEEGAFGISTGLTYPPGSYADTDELTALCLEVNRLGGFYVTHVRYTLGDRFLDPFKEAIQIGRDSGVPVHISHLNNATPGGARRLLDLIDSARNEGLDVTFDSYPYPYSSTRLVSLLPDWTQEGGPEKILEVLNSPRGRRQLEPFLDEQAPIWDRAFVTNFKKPHNRQWDGCSLIEISGGLGKSLVDTMCDLLLEEDLGLSHVAVGGNPLNIREFFKHPAHMIGSDGLLLGDHLNPRTYGTFPMVLGDLVREEQTLDLSQAIRKMTSFPAQRLGLEDRGVLRDFSKADIVVFDPRTVGTEASLKDPKKMPTGIPYVIVNGRIVIDNGHHTGALPGVALRHRINS